MTGYLFYNKSKTRLITCPIIAGFFIYVLLFFSGLCTEELNFGSFYLCVMVNLLISMVWWIVEEIFVRSRKHLSE